MEDNSKKYAVNSMIKFATKSIFRLWVFIETSCQRERKDLLNLKQLPFASCGYRRAQALIHFPVFPVRLLSPVQNLQNQNLKNYQKHLNYILPVHYQRFHQYQVVVLK